jgi:hypothetical protein
MLREKKIRVVTLNKPDGLKTELKKVLNKSADLKKKKKKKMN